MNNIKHLPLIALVSLGVVACGQDDDVDMDGEDEIEVGETNEFTDVEPDGDELAMGELTDEEPDIDDMGMMGDGVSVRLSGFEPTGTIYVALQDETNFASNEATYGTSVEPLGMNVDAVITGITPGDYALAVFQDTNGNGMLDLGPNGVPTEPWYLSGDAGTSGAPAFDDASQTYEMGDTAEVDLSENM